MVLKISNCLFEIISETNENVFWITTCTIYGFGYLQKAISISDYFANRIELGELDDQQMIDIIVKRHRVSGYDLFFEAREADLLKQKFSKTFRRTKTSSIRKKLFFNVK